MKFLTKKLSGLIGLILLLSWNQTILAQAGEESKVYDIDSLGQYNDQARMLILAADYEGGKELLLKLTELGAEPQNETMRSWLYLGIIAHQQGMLNQSLEYYEACIDQYYKISNPDVGAKTMAAHDLENIGNMYTRLGESQKAFLNLKSALKIAEEIENVDIQITCLTDLGTATNTFGELTEAIAYYKQALELFHSNDRWNYNLATIHLDLSDVLLKNGNEKEAEENIEKSISILNQLIKDVEQNPDPNTVQIFLQTYWEILFQAYDSLGQLYAAKGQSSQAILAFQTAISYSEKAFQERRSRELSRVYIHLAELLLKQGELESAILACQDALGGVLPEMKASESVTLPDPDALYPEFVLLEALTTQAYCARALYEKNGDISDLKFAVESHRLANTSAQILRTGIGYDGDKLLLTAETHQRAEFALEAAHALYLVEPTTENWQVAFEFAERSKANLLMDAFQDKEAKLQIGLPDSIIEREEGLQMTLIEAEQNMKDLELSEEQDEETMSQAEEELFLAREQLDVFKRELKAIYPNYFNLKYKTDLPTLSELRAELLGDGVAMIEFFIGDEYVYFFMLTQKEQHLFRKKNTRSLVSLIQQTLTSLVSLKDSDRASYPYNAYSLHQELLGDLPIQPDQRLIIIPDRELALLPFEALLTKEIKEPIPFGGYPFLIKEHVCSYAYSAHLLYQTQTRNQSSRKHKTTFLGMAPGSFPDSDLAELPHTLAEVKTLKKRLGGKAFFAEHAQKEILLSESGAAQILHLSTHAVASDGSENATWIALRDGSDKTIKIRLSELAALNLEADMTVLSACETGAGKIQRGEGVMSLARAFTYAGSQATIQSLWPVRPTAAAPLIEAFYEGLIEGQDKATALHEAKLSLLNGEDPALHAPLMWAAFAAIGDMRAMDISPAWGWKMWGLLGLGVVLLGFGGIAWRKRER